MPKVLLDACVPQWLRAELGDAEVTTARYAGLDHLPDLQLLAAVEGRYDVLVTLDRSIPHQQQLAGRSFAVILLRVRDQTPDSFRALIPAIMQVIGVARPGEVHGVGR
jgi:predicted nuclease of predicted toxin-antitoxin system